MKNYITWKKIRNCRKFTQTLRPTMINWSKKLAETRKMRAHEIFLISCVIGHLSRWSKSSSKIIAAATYSSDTGNKCTTRSINHAPKGRIQRDLLIRGQLIKMLTRKISHLKSFKSINMLFYFTESTASSLKKSLPFQNIGIA